ncbi:MAG: hypothetical protein RLZZ373_3209 [Pseudomonadota bacterium]|jgi:hypothetical protein
MNNAPEVTVLASTPAGDVTMVFGEHQGVRLDGDGPAVALLKSHMLRCVNIDGMSISPDTMHPNDVPFLDGDGFKFEKDADEWGGIGAASLFDDAGGDPILDGDFPGHPFRGNQHVKANNVSEYASIQSRQLRGADKDIPEEDDLLHKTHHGAARTHREAASKTSGGTKKYHEVMADFHSKRSAFHADKLGGKAAVLDSVGADDEWATLSAEFGAMLDSVETDALHDQIRASTSPSERIALCRALLAERARPAAAPPVIARYRYALVNRPPAPGSIPAGLTYTLDPRPAKGQPFEDVARHGIMVTDRELTEAELKSFELLRVDSGSTARVASRVAEDMRDYADAYSEMYESGDASDLSEFGNAVSNRAKSLAGVDALDRTQDMAGMVYEQLKAMVGATAPVAPPAPVPPTSKKQATEAAERLEFTVSDYSGMTPRELAIRAADHRKRIGDAVAAVETLKLGWPAGVTYPQGDIDLASGWLRKIAEEEAKGDALVLGAGDVKTMAMNAGVPESKWPKILANPYTTRTTGSGIVVPSYRLGDVKAAIASATAPMPPAVSDAGIARALAAGIVQRDRAHPTIIATPGWNSPTRASVEVAIIDSLFRETGIDATGRSDDIMALAKELFEQVKNGATLTLPQVMQHSAPNDWRESIVKARTMFGALQKNKLTTKPQDEAAADCWRDLPQLVKVIEAVIPPGGAQDLPPQSAGPSEQFTRYLKQIEAGTFPVGMQEAARMDTGMHDGEYETLQAEWAKRPAPAPVPVPVAPAAINGGPMDGPAPLFRSVSPEEWADILASGRIKGGLNTFNAWDKRREVFFALAPTAGVINQGNEKTRRAEYAVQQGPLQAELKPLAARHHELDGIIQARAVELGARSFDDLDSYLKRKDPVIAPLRPEYDSLDKKISGLQEKGRAEIAAKLAQIKDQDAARGFTSVLLETRPMDGGRVYSGIHSGMGHEVEIGMDSGAVALSDVVRVTFYDGDKAVRQSTPAQESGTQGAAEPAPAPVAAPTGELTAMQNLDRLGKAAPTGAITSDDPDLTGKLERKLEYLNAYAGVMRETNKHIRNKDSTKGDAALRAMGFSDRMIAKLRTKDDLGRVGFADYMLSNNNGEIGRYKKRLERAMEDKASERAAQPAAADTSPAPAVPVPAPALAPLPATDADHDFLQSIISKTADLMAPDIAPRFEEIAARRALDAATMGLLQTAGEVYTQHAIKAAQEALKAMMG